ncbi:MAG: hypothetical protein HOY69_16585, partial [Streptomyces sp.]|nr:hypothetical protein [Streptomyces sp.]
MDRDTGTDPGMGSDGGADAARRADGAGGRVTRRGLIVGAVAAGIAAGGVAGTAAPAAAAEPQGADGDSPSRSEERRGG